jgi:hypothetical protein
VDPGSPDDGSDGSGPAAHGAAGGDAGGIEPPAGTVGVAVTLAEPAVLGVLRAGDRVDLLAVPPTAEGSGPGPRGSSAPAGSPGPGGAATTSAENVLVLATPGGADAAGVYLALAPSQARAVVALPPDTRLAVIVRG